MTLHDNDHFSVEHAVQELPELAEFSMLLGAVRRYLGMQVVFTSRFSGTERVVELVDKSARASWCDLKAGDANPLGESYCFKIVGGQLPNVITDCQQHPVTGKMAVTEALSIGAYVGVPIVMGDGEIYGTLCCYDNQPQSDVSDRDIEFLSTIAAYIGKILAKRCVQRHRIEMLTKQVQSVIDDKKIEVVFQPIFGKESNSYEYYEVLARFNTEPYRPPNEWINDADECGLGLEIESAIINRVVERLALANASGIKLNTSINVSPRMMESGLLPELLKHVNSQQVRIELTEHVRIKDYEQFRTHLEPLVRQGFKICIDDVGAGFASLKHILEIEPDVIKLDLSLAAQIHEDPKRQALVTGLLAFARSFNCEVVAEGVETLEEYRALQNLGVTFFQGWYFSRPVAFESLPDTVCEH